MQLLTEPLTALLCFTINKRSFLSPFSPSVLQFLADALFWQGRREKQTHTRGYKDKVRRGWGGVAGAVGGGELTGDRRLIRDESESYDNIVHNISSEHITDKYIYIYCTENSRGID